MITALHFHNRGAPARHLLALNESCLHRPKQFIAPVHDCLTRCLHTSIHFPSHEWYRAMMSTPFPLPHSRYTCMQKKTQCIADLLGLVRSHVVVQGFCCSCRSIWNGMLTHLALLLSATGLWDRAHINTFAQKACTQHLHAQTHQCKDTPQQR